MMTLIALIAFVVVGWVAASVLGTQAYFLGEQSKPIHERNWDSEEFDQMAKSFTGKETDYGDRTPAYSLDAYSATNN
jgi:archaellin